MAQVLTLSVYGINGSDIVGGKSIGLAVNSIASIQAVAANTTYAGVTVLSVVEFKENSAGINNTYYYSPTAVATVITAANA